MRRAFTLALILAFLSASCASYTPQSVARPTVSSTVASREEQGFLVGVTPYVEAEKSKQIFDADLKQAWILALQVMVSNNGPRRLAVRKSDFILRLPAGKEYLPAPATSVATRLESHAGVIGWTIAFGLIGLLVASSQQDKADSARRADFLSKEFQDTTLAPHESAHGFLFFLIPDDVRELKDTALVARGLIVADATGVTVVVPLGNLGVWHVQEAPTAQRPNF